MKQPFTEEEIWDYAYQIAQALIYLHSHKIIHRDIKALNIFLDKNNKIKVQFFFLKVNIIFFFIFIAWRLGGF